MKTLKSLTTVLFVFVMLKPSVFAQQWDGAQNTTGSIFRMGKVGIGNNNPGGVLDIADPDGLSISGLPYSGQLRVFGKICPQIDLIDKDDKDWSIRANGDCLFFFGESRKSSLTIQQSGKVGIGIDKPISKLDVCGDGTDWSQGFLFLRNKNDKDAGIRLYNDTDVKYHIYNAVSLDNLFRIAPEGNFNGGISINQDGNVGIGTPNPTEKLTVNGNILAENYTYKTAKHDYISVAGSVFIPYADTDVEWVPSEDGYGYLIADPWGPGGLRLCNGNCLSQVTLVNGSIHLRANVVLPDNTRVLSFKCYWYDENINVVADFEFKLMSKPWNNVTAITMATVEGPTTNTAPTGNVMRSTTTTSINLPIISTENNSYYITGTWSVNEMGDELRFYGCRIEYEITHAGSF